MLAGRAGNSVEGLIPLVVGGVIEQRVCPLKERGSSKAECGCNDKELHSVGELEWASYWGLIIHKLWVFLYLLVSRFNELSGLPHWRGIGVTCEGSPRETPRAC